MTTQVNRDVGPRVNSHESSRTSRLRDFVRMNLPTILGSKVGGDTIEFLDKARDEMSRFLIGYSDLRKEKCHTAMLHGNMTLSRLIVYAQYIEECKIRRRGRDVKRGRTDEQVQSKFNKKTTNRDIPSDPKANYERGCGSNLTDLLAQIVGRNIF
ncbi:hypothetical protein EJD97_000716 [Solanum chilense]|uniref:Uncharacterized protein n=1 Tax=Solanum chilense TaxID=4083 RepID=A0A6N2C1Z6_SOLCI|nr:hypothetical protein EJD97_000716 [Solanum chilense]